MNVSNFKEEVNGVKLPKPVVDKLGTLEWPKVNRPKQKTHVSKIGASVKANGLLVGIPVTPRGANGKRQVLNCNHTSDSLIVDLGLPKDTVIPMTEAWWVDPDNPKSVQKAIMTLNNNVSSWTIEDRVNSFADTIGGIYKTIQRDIRTYSKKGITPAGIVSCYTTSNRGHGDDFNEGEFQLEGWREEYIRMILQKFGILVSSWNTRKKKHQTKVKATFLREIFRSLMLEAESLNNMEEWSVLLNKTVEKTEDQLEEFGYVPTGDALPIFWDGCKRRANR